MVGTSNTSAPLSRNWRESWPACSRARVTTMRCPKNGRRSNQFSFSRSLTTLPTTARAGGPMRSRAATPATAASVLSTEC